MTYKLSCFFFLIIILSSCKNDNQKRLEENERQVKKSELIFSNINKGWVFYDTPINTTSETTVASWSELRVFFAELAVKPKKTIGAFQKKSKALSEKVMALNENIPSQFNKPQIKSRVSTLITITLRVATGVASYEYFCHLSIILIMVLSVNPSIRLTTLVNDTNGCTSRSLIILLITRDFKPTS